MNTVKGYYPRPLDEWDIKLLAPGIGIEPILAESKSVVLPLHYPGIIKQDTFTFQVQIEFFKFAVSILNWSG